MILLKLQVARPGSPLLIDLHGDGTWHTVNEADRWLERSWDLDYPPDLNSPATGPFGQAQLTAAREEHNITVLEEHFAPSRAGVIY